MDDNKNQPRLQNASAPPAAATQTNYDRDQTMPDNRALLTESLSPSLATSTVSYSQEQLATSPVTEKNSSPLVLPASDSATLAIAQTQNQSGRQNVPFQISKYITTTPNIHKTGTTTTITAAEAPESSLASSSFLVSNRISSQGVTNNPNSIFTETSATVSKTNISTLSAAAAAEFQIPTQFLTLTAPQIDVQTLVQLKETLFSATQYLQHADQVIKYYRSQASQLKLQNQLLMIETHEASQRHEVENHLIKRELDRLRFDQIDRQNEAAAAAAAAEPQFVAGSTSNLSGLVHQPAGSNRSTASGVASPGSTDSDTYRRRLQRAKLRIRDYDKELEQKNKEVAMLKKRLRESRLHREALEDALVKSSTPGSAHKLLPRHFEVKYNDDNDNDYDNDPNNNEQELKSERPVTPPSLQSKNQPSALNTPQSATTLFNTRAPTTSTTRDNGLDALGFLASQALQDQQNRNSVESESPRRATTTTSFQDKSTSSSHSGPGLHSLPALRFPSSGTVSAGASLTNSPKKGHEKAGLRSPVAFKKKLVSPNLATPFPLIKTAAVATDTNVVSAVTALKPAADISAPHSSEKRRRRESTGSTISNSSDHDDKSNSDPPSPKKQALQSSVKAPQTPSR